MALLTVGSTEFTAFVQSALSERVLEALILQGYRSFVVQHGKGRLISDGGKLVRQYYGRIDIELHDFITDIEERMNGADLILSHGGQPAQLMVCTVVSKLKESLCDVLKGAASILAALRGPALSPKSHISATQLVIVPNDTLMDGHQSELADEMKSNGWATVATPESVIMNVASSDSR